MSLADLKTNDSAAHAPEQVQRWVRRLLTAQDCPGVLSRETSGYHLYLPCPSCLETHGRRELDDPKYAINISKLAGLDDGYRDVAATGKASWMPAAAAAREDLERKRDYNTSVCMRTRSAREPHRFSIEELLHMGTVTERHPDILTRQKLSGGAGSADREDHWEEDQMFGSGEKVPPPPGDRVLLSSLPGRHPAVVYLTSRGYDIGKLEEQFGCCYCTREYPMGKNKIFYRRMPGGWKDTPQHRVIFHSLIDGAPRTWQARVIEREDDDGLTRLMLHPYAGGFFPGAMGAALKAFKEGAPYPGVHDVVHDPKRGGYWCHTWSRTHTRANPKAPWQPLPPFDEMRGDALRFQPSKYRTAKHSSREMMGWDAAVRRADEDTTTDMRWCVLMEGPLDGGRAGPGGIPLIGSSISPENAEKVAATFHLVFTAFDMDSAGKLATEKVTRMLRNPKHRAPIINDVVPLPIPPGKDPGDMTDGEWSKMFGRVLKRTQRYY